MSVAVPDCSRHLAQQQQMMPTSKLHQAGVTYIWLPQQPLKLRQLLPAPFRLLKAPAFDMNDSSRVSRR